MAIAGARYWADHQVKDDLISHDLYNAFGDCGARLVIRVGSSLVCLPTRVRDKELPYLIHDEDREQRAGEGKRSYLRRMYDPGLGC